MMGRRLVDRLAAGGVAVAVVAFFSFLGAPAVRGQVLETPEKVPSPSSPMPCQKTISGDGVRGS